MRAPVGFAIAYQVVSEGPEPLVFSTQISDLFAIWLSRYTRSGSRSAERGEHERKGLPGTWRLPAVVSA